MELQAALMNAACEVPNPKPDDKSPDLKGKLEITLVPSMPTISPGGHANFTLTLSNKSSAPIALSFTLDPTPRFPTETYDAKKKRVDMPATKPPPLPQGMPPERPRRTRPAHITIVPNGTAKTTIPWDAVKMRWAPEKSGVVSREWLSARRRGAARQRGLHCARGDAARARVRRDRARGERPEDSELP